MHSHWAPGDTKGNETPHLSPSSRSEGRHSLVSLFPHPVPLITTKTHFLRHLKSWDQRAQTDL